MWPADGLAAFKSCFCQGCSPETQAPTSLIHPHPGSPARPEAPSPPLPLAGSRQQPPALLPTARGNRCLQPKRGGRGGQEGQAQGRGLSWVRVRRPGPCRPLLLWSPAWLPRGDDTGDLAPSLASRPLQVQRFGVEGESQLPLLWPGLESGLWGQTRKEGRQARVRRRAREWLPTWKTPCASADTAACSGVRPMLSCMLASALASSRRLAASERE